MMTSTRTTTTACLLLSLSLLAGCQNTAVTHQLKCQELAWQSWSEFLTRHHDYGLVEVVTYPRTRKLLIDGAEFLGNPNEIRLPVGPHDFTASWPNGKVSRKVYVTPAEISGETCIKYKASATSVRWGTDTPPGRVKKSKIVIKLKKP